MEMTHRQAQRVEIEWAAGLEVMLGLWLVLSPFAFTLTGQPVLLWNNVILGIAIAVLGFIKAAVPEGYAYLGWVSAILGAWVVISPFVLGYSGVGTALWSDVVTGLAVLALALWSGMQTRSMAGSRD